MATDIDDNVLDSVAVSARALGVGMTKCWELIRDGHLETVKIGRRTLVKRRSRLQLVEHGVRTERPGSTSN